MSEDAAAILAAIRADLRAAELAGLLDADPAGDYFPAALARHSSVLLAAVEAVLNLTRDGDGDDLYPSIDITVGEVREAITAALAGTGKKEGSEDE